MIIAIDGTAGSGKSTAARAVADRLKLQHLDSGACYRAVALEVLRRGIDPDDVDAVVGVAAEVAASLSLSESRLRVGGAVLGPEIRTPEISSASSKVARHPGVREIVVAVQRSLVPVAGAVIDGRDISTVVWPTAEVKVWLDADPNARSQRQGEQVVERDARDASRPVGAAVPASDAVHIDTSTLTPDQVRDAILDLVPQDKPQILYRLLRGFAVLILRFAFRISRRFQGTLPKGGVILAANHRSFLDIPALASVTGRQVHFMAKREVMETVWGRLFRACGAYPVSRGAIDRHALGHTLELLKSGLAVGIFPAGTRTPDGGFAEINNGTAWLALKSGVPVVPVAISGAESVFPPHRKVPSFHRIHVLAGTPVRLGGPYPGRPPRSAVELATRRLEAMGQALLGELE